MQRCFLGAAFKLHKLPGYSFEFARVFGFVLFLLVEVSRTGFFEWKLNADIKSSLCTCHLTMIVVPSEVLSRG